MKIGVKVHLSEQKPVLMSKGGGADPGNSKRLLRKDVSREDRIRERLKERADLSVFKPTIGADLS